MSETPAPQNPGQPSPAPRSEPLSGSDPAAPPISPPPATPPPADSKLDWRLGVIVGMVVLLLIAVYVNKKFYSSNTPPAEAESSAPAVTSEVPAPAAPPMSQAERYARMLQARAMEIQGEMYSEGGRALLVAAPGMPTSRNENAKEPDMVIPGTLFDVTKTAEGVRPEMLQRGDVYGGKQLQPLFMDMFPPLGGDGQLQMVLKPAAGAPPDVVADDQAVVGVKVGAEARAYPLKFMHWHNVINDTLAGQPIAVAWSAEASAPSAVYRGDLPAFGSAGLIFQGAIVMYTKEEVPASDGTKIERYSLWSPTLHLCIAGDRAGARLKPLQADLVSWKTWKTLYPETTVLVGTTPPAPFDYTINPAIPPDYLDLRNPAIPHPVYGLDVDKTPLPLKAPVFGITDSQGKAAKAYPLAYLGQKKGPFEDAVGDRKLTLQYNPDTLILSAKDAQGNPVLTEPMLWIAWLGAHPKTAVWQPAPAAPPMAPSPAATSAPAAAPSASAASSAPAGTAR